MKRTHLLFTFLLLYSLTQSQILNTLYFEGFGFTNVGSTPINSYTRFDNQYVNYSGTSTIRIDRPSPTGSGGANALFTAGRSIIISGINTLCYDSVVFTMKHYKNLIGTSNELLMAVSTDGVNWENLSYSRPTGTGTNSWVEIRINEFIPISDSVFIRIRNSTAFASEFRIDDLNLTGICSYLCCEPLPVVLLSFSAAQINGAINLQWKTASEFNNMGFSIQRYEDGKFVTIGEILGNNRPSEYGYFDYTYSKTDEVIYYRLKQKDFDDKKWYSSVISLAIKPRMAMYVKYYNVMGQEVVDLPPLYIESIIYDDGSVQNTLIRK